MGKKRIIIRDNNEEETVSRSVLADDWDTELARISAAYAEVSRRDTSLETRLARSHLRESALCVVIVLLAALCAWFFAARTMMQSYVQVVQVEEGHVYTLGAPIKALEYEPAEVQWRDMLATWVPHIRWRSSDVTQTKRDWAWAYAHTCGKAIDGLKALEASEKPFSTPTTLLAVQLRSITASDVPKAYTVLWEEKPQQGEVVRYAGTFTVGRRQPVPLLNGLGICVTAFNFTQQG